MEKRQPALKPVHPVSSLSKAKLASVEKMSTQELKKSLEPGHGHCLKARPDGTMLDGHHRVHILKGRGVNVDALPREVVEKR